jgi:hypothetical protein
MAKTFCQLSVTISANSQCVIGKYPQISKQRRVWDDRHGVCDGQISTQAKDTETKNLNYDGRPGHDATIQLIPPRASAQQLNELAHVAPISQNKVTIAVLESEGKLQF